MSKTLYYRETDSLTGTQKWIKLNGIKGTNKMLFLDKKKFEKIDDPLFIVYKSTKESRLK